MRNFIFIALALLLFGAVAKPAMASMPSFSVASFSSVPSMFASASAPYTGPRHKFAKPNVPLGLAKQTRAALTLDPTGRHAIDGPNCGRACGTPEDLMEMLHAPDSDVRDIAPQDLNQLPDFIGQLQLQKAPPGVYYMACKSGDGSASATPIWNCMARAFHAGEMCYAYKGRCVFARDCSNPVGRERHEEGCVRQWVYMHKGDILRGAPMAAPGVSPMPQGECTFMVQEPGSDEQAYPPKNKCPEKGCDYSQISARLNIFVVGRQFSFQAQTDGWAIVYLPIEVKTWKGVMEYCIEPADGRRMAGEDIHKTAYHNNDAYLVFDPSQAPAEWHGLPHVWGEDRLYSDGYPR